MATYNTTNGHFSYVSTTGVTTVTKQPNDSQSFAEDLAQLLGWVQYGVAQGAAGVGSGYTGPSGVDPA